MSKITPIKIKQLKKKEIIEIESTDLESDYSIPKLNENKMNKNINTEKKTLQKDPQNKEIKVNKISESIYDRPDMTYTEKLSKVQIQDLLVDYEQIKDNTELSVIPPGTHLRYFQMVNSKLKFRTGGILTVKSGLPNYVILSSGKVSWSVQVAECIFFKRITIKQLKKEFNKLLEDKQKDIISLNNLLKSQSNEIIRLKGILKSNNIDFKE